jgi:hypothetical protein
MGKSRGIVFPLNRLGFWVCVVVGLVLGAILLVKAMANDLGLR